MRKYKQIKRKHHYVWRFYLEQWSIMNDVFYLSKKGKVSNGGTKGLSVEKGFYKINMLAEKDVHFIKSFSRRSPIELQRLHMSFLQNFIVVSGLSEMLDNVKSEDSDVLREAMKYNGLEDLHSIVEKGVLPVLKGLCKGNVRILDLDQNMIAFCSYVGHQLTRTRHFKKLSIDSTKRMQASETFPQEYYDLLEKNWWFLSFMLGINVGVSLADGVRKPKHIFIENKTNVAFITSDNPVINIHASLSTLDKGQVPDEMDLYFPLSPRYAYMINESSDYDELTNGIDESTVHKLNMFVYKKSGETVYGNSADSIRSVINAASN